MKDGAGSKFEIFSLKQSLRKTLALNLILGESKIIKDLRRKIECLSESDANVLITGESGTGKEPTARGIHYLSSRSTKPFVPVNCGAIPESLFENELFGHVKGAFTDARYQQNGLIGEAGGGTLFLDEVGVITPYIQVKLLRLLQDKEYKPLGDNLSRKANIRIIAATNENLKELVEKGAFREDLYYRLDIVSFNIPPLRERVDDIPILAHHFVEKFSHLYCKPVRGISAGAMEKLVSYHWPGNVRELENKIQQAIVMTNGEIIDVHDLQLYMERTITHIDYLENFNQAKRKFIYAFEKNYLINLLTRFNGDVVTAAATAGKSRTAFWNLLARHQLNPRHFSQGST
ncbi:MAG TPA: sigma-54 dependent transcriptional regulator [Candidatus Kapabacteria bacterium]|nr:sigma-54 dependent transcriptional regulator [Candidatus Kapabacteria bacterium]